MAVIKNARSVIEDPSLVMTETISSELKERQDEPVSNLNSSPSSSDQLKSPFICGTCNTEFPEKHEFLIHLNSHLEKKLLKCEVCGMLFLRRSSLIDHMLVHRMTSSMYQCEKCGKIFLRKSVLVRHAKFHLENKPLKCDKCGKTFVQRCDLRKHLSMHIKEMKSHKCEQCDVKFSKKLDLVNHLKMHNISKESEPNQLTKQFKCDQCSEVFNHKYDLVEHRKIHLSPDQHKLERRNELIKHLEELKVRLNTLCTEISTDV